jgi:ABC-type transporter Mla subunit MlaD
VATVKAKFSPIAAEDTASDVTSVAIPPARLSDLIAAITTTGIDAFNSALEQLTAISGKLDTLSTALETAVTTIKGDIAAAEGRIRGDIAGVKALVLEVSNNVSQAILVVADQNKAILDKLDKMNATLVSVSGGVAKLSTDVDGLATLIRAANLSISQIVVDQAGRVIAALSDSEGRIVGAISALSTDVDGLATLIRAAIAADAEAFDRVMRHLTDISGKLDTLITALETAVTTIKGDIAAAEDRIRGDIAALVLEVNTNVGLVAQAVLTVADQNNAILARLGDIDAKLTGVSSGVAKLSTDVAGLASLVKAANLSISQIVVDQAGRVIATLRDSEGRIVGAISTNAKTLSDLITAVGKDVAGVAASVKTLSDTLATFQSGAFSKLDAISGSVDAARADLARLRTDAAAMASVVAGIQTTVSRVDTNVGGLVDTAKTIATTVDSINKAVPGLATKADVSNAQTAITGAVDKAKSDLQSAVESTEDTASTSSRNWGAINSILVIIAIAILAYSTFVARRA